MRFFCHGSALSATTYGNEGNSIQLDDVELPDRPSKQEAAHVFCMLFSAAISTMSLLASLWITGHQPNQLGLHLRGDPCTQSLELLQRCLQGVRRSEPNV